MMTIPKEPSPQDPRLLLIQQAQQFENDWEQDEQFIRLKSMIEALISDAQDALVYRVEQSSSSDHHRRRTSNDGGRRARRHRAERSTSTTNNTTPTPTQEL